MGEEEGDGDGHSSILPECVEMFKNIQFNQERMNRALWGGEGTTGMVKDINDIKMSNRFLIFLGATIVGVVSAVVTAILIIMIGGKP